MYSFSGSSNYSTSPADLDLDLCIEITSLIDKIKSNFNSNQIVQDDIS